MMSWEELKDKVYFLDGSLRDIYILNTTEIDWKIWAKFVNSNYDVSHYINGSELTKDQIQISNILPYWNGSLEHSSTATITINNIKINAHFFCKSEIENDITPKEIINIDHHNSLMNYMIAISELLSKEVILTEENSKKEVLISVKGKQIRYT